MLSHPYVALSPTLYPLSSRPALPAGECWLILSSTATTNIQPLMSHSFAPPHPPHTPSHVSSGLPQEGTHKSPITLLDDDDKPPPPKHRLSPGHGMPDNESQRSSVGSRSCSCSMLLLFFNHWNHMVDLDLTMPFCTVHWARRQLLEKW